jgi:hypothetical protein
MAKKKTRRDIAQIARENLEQIIGEKLTGEPLERPKPEEEHGRLRIRASKGGEGRAKKLTEAQREAIAKRAAESRWGRKK